MEKNASSKNLKKGPRNCGYLDLKTKYEANNVLNADAQLCPQGI
jgi:hypothetical protein